MVTITYNNGLVLSVDANLHYKGLLSSKAIEGEMTVELKKCCNIAVALRTLFKYRKLMKID